MPDYTFGNNGIIRGANTPEGDVKASPGTIYIRSIDSTIFEKRSGTDTTGWVKNNAIVGTNNIVADTTNIDLNTNGDQSLTVTPTKYRITDIVFSEPSSSLIGSLLLSGQIYTSSGGSGDRCLSNVPKNLLGGASAIANATIHSDISNKILTAGTLYYRNTGLLGSSGNMNVTIYGIDLS